MADSYAMQSELRSSRSKQPIAVCRWSLYGRRRARRHRHQRVHNALKRHAEDLEGHDYAYTIGRGGRALQALVDNTLTPMLLDKAPAT